MKKFHEDDATRIGNPAGTDKKIPGRLQASVVIIEGQARGMEYMVSKTYTVIGRDKAAEIRPPGDSHVSRRHAAIVYQDGNYVLRDLESTNGTLIDGALIKQANLRHGDKFRVGETTFQFILQDNPHLSTTCEIE